MSNEPKCETCIIPATRTPDELEAIVAAALNREKWLCVAGHDKAHYYVCNKPLGVASQDGMIRMLMERGRDIAAAKSLVACEMDLFL